MIKIDLGSTRTWAPLWRTSKLVFWQMNYLKTKGNRRKKVWGSSNPGIHLPLAACLASQGDVAWATEVAVQKVICILCSYSIYLPQSESSLVGKACWVMVYQQRIRASLTWFIARCLHFFPAVILFTPPANLSKSSGHDVLPQSSEHVLLLTSPDFSRSRLFLPFLWHLCRFPFLMALKACVPRVPSSAHFSPYL